MIQEGRGRYRNAISVPAKLFCNTRNLKHRPRGVKNQKPMVRALGDNYLSNYGILY